MVPLYSHRIPRVRWYSFKLLSSIFRVQDLYLLWLSFPAYSTRYLFAFAFLGCFPFARRYLGNRVFFLFLRVLRCFSSPGFASIQLCIHCMIHDSSSCGFPHSDTHGSYLCADPRGFRLLPSFFASMCQGIHLALFSV